MLAGVDRYAPGHCEATVGIGRPGANRPVSPAAVLSPRDQAIVLKCLSCPHLTREPLRGLVPALSCSAAHWHCHYTGHRSKLRRILSLLNSPPAGGEKEET